MISKLYFFNVHEYISIYTFIVETDAFLEAYTEVCNKFVKTQLSENCMELLNKTGIAFLSGTQGCGKTLTAVHIMIRHKENGYKTRKITSHEDLLHIALAAEGKTLVYIDNILDGFLYREKVQNWWNSLCYFYFDHVKTDKNIRLLITAKDSVKEKACVYIREDIEKCTFFIKAESFPLTTREKKEILKSQFELAKKLKGIENSEIDEKLDDLKFVNIGFPLCAHLFAFEDRMCKKSVAIFNDPKFYVITHIADKIQEDKRVLTLFLVLLFYISPNDSTDKIVDLKYGQDCKEYLEKMVSKNFVETMKEKLRFDELLETARSLQHTILVKHSARFEFKHHIYLEGVIEYFVKEYPVVAVQHFPLDALRTCDFADTHEGKIWDAIIKRFKVEIPSGIPAVLSCAIFKSVKFEKRFCEELTNDNTLQAMLFIPTVSELDLSIQFWASKSRLYKLSEAADRALDVSEQQTKVLFYQARFGECCEKEPKYFVQFISSMNADNIPDSTNLKNIEAAVWKFGTSEHKSILHITLSSDKVDLEAHRIIKRLLKDALDHNCRINNDILHCALKQTSYSRVLCILEILQMLSFIHSQSKRVSVSTVVNEIKNCRTHNDFLELELLVRICILLTYKSIQNIPRAIVKSIDQKYRYVRELLQVSENIQTEMTRIVNECLSRLNVQVPNCLKSLEIPGEENFDPALEKAIIKSIWVLSDKNIQQGR